MPTQLPKPLFPWVKPTPAGSVGTGGISEQSQALALRLPSTHTLRWAEPPGGTNPNPKGQPQTKGLRASLLHKNISRETGAVDGPSN